MQSCNAAVAGFEGEVYVLYAAKPNMEFTGLVGRVHRSMRPFTPTFPHLGVSAPRDDVLKVYNCPPKPARKTPNV